MRSSLSPLSVLLACALAALLCGATAPLHTAASTMSTPPRRYGFKHHRPTAPTPTPIVQHAPPHAHAPAAAVVEPVLPVEKPHEAAPAQAAVNATSGWHTIGGSNLRQGVSSLPVPVNFGAPMKLQWEGVLTLADGAIGASTCASGMVADATGLVFLLCAGPIDGEADSKVLQPALLCFDVLSAPDAPMLQWRAELDPVPIDADPTAPLSASMALTEDGQMLVVSTRAALYAYLAPVGKREWVYMRHPLVGVSNVAPGILLSSPDDSGMQRVYSAYNQGVAMVVAGQLVWSYTPTFSLPLPGTQVSAPVEHVDSRSILYAYWDPLFSSVVLVCVDAYAGLEKWSKPFLQPSLAAGSAAMVHQSHPLVHGDRAYLSVVGRGLVVVDIPTGAVLADGTGLFAGKRVQVGVAPVYLAEPPSPVQREKPHRGRSRSFPITPPQEPLLMSVCTESLASEPVGGRTFQLCATDLNGTDVGMVNLYTLGCSNPSDGGSWSTMAPVSQPLMGRNRVLLLALSSRAFVPLQGQAQAQGEAPHPDAASPAFSCVLAVTNKQAQTPSWHTPLGRGQSIHATPLLLQESTAVGLLRNPDGTIALFAMKKRQPEPEPEPEPQPGPEEKREAPVQRASIALQVPSLMTLH